MSAEPRATETGGAPSAPAFATAPTSPPSLKPEPQGTEPHEGAGSVPLPMFEGAWDCMQCGFCLPACPTYQLTGNERSSPRGRIALMKGVAVGGIEVTADWSAEMDFCLGCRACETACPAGVEYGGLIEEARALAEERVGREVRPRWERALRKAIFDGIFPHQRRLKALGLLAWAYQKVRLDSMVDWLGARGLFPQRLATKARMLPPLPSPRAGWGRQAVYPAMGATQHKVGLLTGCINDIFFSEMNSATIRVLQENGCEVHLVPGQTCCGALHAHAGQPAGAKRLAGANIDAFERAGVDVIINNAAGCGAMLKEYDHLLRDDAAYAERAGEFVRRVRDVNEFLAGVERAKPRFSLPVRVTYQDPCHLVHGQGIKDAPRRLMREIPGLKLVEMPHSDQCCGSAGIYNIVQTESAVEVLDRKMAEVKEADPEILVTANTGCLAQLQFGLKEEGLEEAVRVMHVVQLLDWAYRGGGPAVPLKTDGVGGDEGAGDEAISVA